MYSLAVQPIIKPIIRNKMVRNEPNTKLTANIFLTPGCLDRKFKVNIYFPSQKANHLFKHNVKWSCFLSLTSIEQEFNTTIYVVFIFIYVKT